MSLTLSSKCSPFPFSVIAIAAYTGKAAVVFDETASGITLELDGSVYHDEHDIVEIIGRVAHLIESDLRTPAYYTLAKAIKTATLLHEINTALNLLDNYLAYHSFLVDHEISASDWAIWGAIRGNVKIIGILKNNTYQHLGRWITHLESLNSTQTVLNDLVNARAQKARSNKTAATFALGLQDTTEGKVVTRFPPEPSGYLHIGHTKAAILNQYFAKMYKGKLIVRFDDTNPSKEKTEFEETILEDLKLLDIKGDIISHTSNYFQTIYDYAIQLIKDGKAYADDTEQLQMREERGKGIPSKHRDDSVEDNLKQFEDMTTGSKEGSRWCLRAKISVDDNNKALRDPVIYRVNTLPHHRTGDQWKVYPTYDFACPIVDSIEGVTHALRTNEYRDRNPQYHWMIEALGIRKVHIWDFSRLNFIYTLLSKRKLHWFVNEGLVSGWDDPRFPTVRGIRRRGMTVEALTQFMLSQGPSQAVVSLEWDSIWTLNKKIIDPIAPRFWAICKENSVCVTLTNGPSTSEVRILPKHKKNPEVGQKMTVYSSKIIIEQEDAASFEDQEEITLMDWGNAIVRQKQTDSDSSGKVLSIVMDLYLDGDFRKTKKKITWLAEPTACHSLPSITLTDFDYLITKKKLEEEDNVADFVTPVTEFRESAFGDANVLNLQKGDIIQFERKGFYIYDNEKAGVMEFFKIPDGRAAGIASKATLASSVATSASGVSNSPQLVESSVSQMYKMASIYGNDDNIPEVDTKMYKMGSVYST